MIELMNSQYSLTRLIATHLIPIHFQKKSNRLRHAGQSEQRERRSGIQRNCQKAQPFAFIFFKKQRIKRFAFWHMCWIPSGRSLRSLISSFQLLKESLFFRSGRERP